MKRFAFGPLLAGASLVAMASAGPALAQTAPAADRDGDNEIIVTAQKREERLQDVPLTISVVSGERLEQQAITNLSDLQNATPELNYIGQPSAGYSIRGSGTQSFARSSENNVLLVIDGIVYGQLTPSEGSLFDVAQVEVLSGPQGMLFGKNASAGVINISTVRPALGETSGRVRVSAGENGYFTANAVANLPLGEQAALRLSVSRDQRGGQLVNRFNGQTIDESDNTSFRARLLWELSPNLVINAIADTERQNGGNNAWQARSAPNTSPTSVGGRLAACGVVPGPENTEVCLDGPTDREIESQGVSVQVDWTIGDYTITSITGYRAYTRAVDTDSDTRPINALNQNFASDDITQWTQELRLASPAQQRLSYVVGAFWYDYQYDSLNNQSGTLGALPFVATRSFTDDVLQQSYALFGQANLGLTDTLDLVLGARQTWDKLKLTNRAFANPALGVRFAPAFSPAVDAILSRSITEDNLSYRVGLQWEPSDDLTLFATYSRGYKGPAINNTLAGSAAPPFVNAEIPTNIEVGIKGVFFDGRVRSDLTLFDTTSEDFQAQTAVIVNGLTQFVFANASELNFQGAQWNLYANPVDGLNITGGVLYNQATYGDFIVQCNAPFLAGCTPVAGGANVINANGRQLAGAPEWKFTFGLGYEHQLREGALGFVDLSAAYRSDTNTSATPDPNLVIPAYTLVDARVGVRSDDGRMQFALFGKNIFDERAAGFIFRDPLSPTNNYMQSFASNAFRTVGVSLEFNF